MEKYLKSTAVLPFPVVLIEGDGHDDGDGGGDGGGSPDDEDDRPDVCGAA